MCHFLFGLSGYYFLYHHFGELLTVTVLTTVTFATLLLEDDYFVALHERHQHLAFYFGALYGGSSHLDGSIYVEKEYFVEAYCVAFLHVAQMMDIQEFAFLGLELLPFDFYDCVHR